MPTLDEVFGFCSPDEFPEQKFGATEGRHILTTKEFFSYAKRNYDKGKADAEKALAFDPNAPHWIDRNITHVLNENKLLLSMASVGYPNVFRLLSKSMKQDCFFWWFGQQELFGPFSTAPLASENLKAYIATL